VRRSGNFGDNGTITLVNQGDALTWNGGNVTMEPLDYDNPNQIWTLTEVTPPG
jgi:hypothetical protein